MEPVNIILADDHRLVAEGLKDMLEQNTAWEVVAVASNGRQALSLVHQHKPDLLITDLNMPDKDGFELIADMKARFPAVRVIVISMYASPAIVKKAFEAGIDGYLLKEQGSAEVREAIEQVLAGNTYTNRMLAAEDAEPGPYKDDFRTKAGLTDRELEVLRLIAQSLTNKEIGEKLFISEFTVQTHRRNLKRKLKADKTADLVRFAYDNQLV